MRNTFALQSKLPRLPIPKLDSTLQKYLVSLRPFPALTTGGTEKIVNTFLSDPKQGPLLQQRLTEYDSKQAVHSSITYL
jgi:carnitine O-acetyltransferase